MPESHPSPFDRIELHYAHWPKTDREAWERLFVEGDILDDAGPLHHWREGTRRKAAGAYGTWLARCGRTGTLSLAPWDRVTPEAVAEYASETRSRCSAATAHLHANELLKLMRAMRPDLDWSRIDRIVQRLQSQAPAKSKRRLPVTARELCCWGMDRMRSYEEMGGISEKGRAVGYRQGLCFALLIARPLRRRTYLNLKIGQHIKKQNGIWTIMLAPDDVKDARHHFYDVPDFLQEPIQKYIDHHREVLLGGNEYDDLWITKYGRPFSVPGLVSQFTKLSKRHLGFTMRVHVFRSVAMTSLAIEDPEHVRIGASILGHKTLATSEKHYNLARELEAVASYNGLLADERKSAMINRKKRR